MQLSRCFAIAFSSILFFRETSDQQRDTVLSLGSLPNLKVLAGIKTLEALLFDFRRQEFDPAPLVEKVRSLRPDIEVVVAEKGASGPPRREKTSR